MADEPTVEASLVRLERRLDDLERMIRDMDQRTGAAAATTPQSVPAQPSILASSIVSTEQNPPQANVPEQTANPIQPASIPVAATPQWSMTDIENLVTGRLLAWVGGLAILVGALFFLSMAFSNGWIGPGARVIIGLVTSIVLVGSGAWFFERREVLFGHVLVAVGIGVTSISLLAATRLYDFIPAELGLLGSLASAIVASGIAIRANSQLVALYGLVAALVAPQLLDASPNLVTVGFVAAALTGMVIISLERTWKWLPPVAFVLSAPQAAAWLTDSGGHAARKLLVLAGFWALYTIAAGGAEFRRPTSTLQVGSATVMLANAAFLVWAGFEILDGDLERWRGTFLVIVAIAHTVLGGYFLSNRQDRHPFGLLAFGAGIASLSLAFPVQLGGPPVPLAWAAEAAALAWLYGQRRHGYSGAVSAILGALAIAHLFTVEYPFWEVNDGIRSDIPFLNPSGATLSFLVVAAIVSGFLARSGRIRSVLAVTSIGIVTLAIPFEIQTPAAVVVAWSCLAGLAFMLAGRDSRHAPLYTGAAVLILALGFLRTLSLIVPPERLTVEASSSIDHPLFMSAASAALLSLIIALSLGAWYRRGHDAWRLLAVPAAILAVYLLSVGVVDEFQSRVTDRASLASVQKQAQVTLSILWAILGGCIFLTGVLRLGAMVRSFGLALLAVASAKVFIYDLASLDTSYRVLSFIGLGILLLASSFAYQHFMPLIERGVRAGPTIEETPRT